MITSFKPFSDLLTCLSSSTRLENGQRERDLPQPLVGNFMVSVEVPPELGKSVDGKALDVSALDDCILRLCSFLLVYTM